MLDIVEKELQRRMLEDYNQDAEEDEIAQGCMASMIMFVRQLNKKHVEDMYMSMNNNAPGRIYVVDATFPDYVDFDGSPINTKRIDDHDIEYTRTDAFIEKAVSYIQQYWIWNTKMIDDFRKYMEE